MFENVLFAIDADQITDDALPQRFLKVRIFPWNDRYPGYCIPGPVINFKLVPQLRGADNWGRKRPCTPSLTLCNGSLRRRSYGRKIYDEAYLICWRGVSLLGL